MSTVPQIPPQLYRMTVDEYDRIGELLDDPRVELIDGLLMKKKPKTPEHGSTTKGVLKALENRLAHDWMSDQYRTVRIPVYDEPEPDVTIIRGSNDDYKHRHPTAAEVTLLGEVSESSLALDRGKKLEVYARSGIPVYWIVNLVDRQVEVYTSPGPAGYQSRQDYQTGDLIPVVIDGQQLAPIAVDDILP